MAPTRSDWRMPAEYQAQRRIWMLWPERADNWREAAAPAQAAFAQLASSIADFEAVTIGVNPAGLDRARTLLDPRVELAVIASNDAWMRDTGPCFTLNAAGRRRAVDWGFNAWGGSDDGLYRDWAADDAVAGRVAELAGWPATRGPLVLEGGAIHVDGAGTGLATVPCLLNPNRNPGLARGEVEATLHDWLGIEQLIWLPEGLAGDETGGHIDNLCCFLRPGLVALAWTDDPTNAHYAVCRQAAEALAASRDATGRALEVLALPLPEGVAPMSHEESAGLCPQAGTRARPPGTPLTASYINFLFVNGGIILPAFGVSEDGAAAAILRQAFPERRVLSLPAREILLGGGGIHCVTLAEPARDPDEAEAGKS